MFSKIKNKKTFITGILFALTLVTSAFVINNIFNTAHANDSDPTLIAMDVYKESIATTPRTTKPLNGYDAGDQDLFSTNPERGFYSSVPIKLIHTPINGSCVATPGYKTRSDTSKTLYLKVDLSDFSNSMNGGQGDRELSAGALQDLEYIIAQMYKNDQSIILRFVYDNGATGYISGVSKCEPSQEMLLKHIMQLKPILQGRYGKAINVLQCGFYGLWGEAYYNTDASDPTQGPKNYKTLLPTLLNATAGTDITIATRTPQYYSWGAGVDIANIESQEPKALSESEWEATGVPTTTADGVQLYYAPTTQDWKRVSVFNDAYGASWDDLGTYLDREREVDWLSNQTQTSFYGGEAIVDTISPINWNNIGPFNTGMYFIKEAKKLHTSYINWEWNQELHKQWSYQIYTNGEGSDIPYNGQSILKYIENHLGYRLVMRGSKTTLDNATKQISTKISIENVGFANIIKNKRVDLILVDPFGRIEQEITNVSYDEKKLLSGTVDTQEFICNISADLKLQGDYKVYMRISSGERMTDDLAATDQPYYSAIKFANDKIWNEQVQGNLIGHITSTTGDDPATLNLHVIYHNEDGSVQEDVAYTAGMKYKNNPTKLWWNTIDGSNGVVFASNTNIDISTAAEGEIHLYPAKVAFAVWSVTDNTLNFYKRSSSVPIEGASWNDGTKTITCSKVYKDIETTNYYAWGDGLPKWRQDAENGTAITANCKAIVADEGIQPISTAAWFAGWWYSSVDITKLDTSKTINMQQMFDSSCITEIDLSHTSFVSVSNLHYLFSHCAHLKTVKVSSATWDISKAEAATGMFRECTSIKGGLGTTWSDDNVSLRRIDKPGQPGYLTDINSVGPYNDIMFYVNSTSDWNARPLGNSYTEKAISVFDKATGAKMFANETWGIPSGWSVDKVTVYTFSGNGISDDATYEKSAYGADYIFNRTENPDFTKVGGQPTLDINNGALRFVVGVSPVVAPVIPTYTDYITAVYKDSWGTNLNASYNGKEISTFDKTNGAKIFDPDTYGISLPSGYIIDQVTVYSYNWVEKATYYHRTWIGDSGWHARLSNYIFKRQAEPDLSHIGGQSILNEHNGSLRFVIIVKPGPVP